MFLGKLIDNTMGEIRGFESKIREGLGGDGTGALPVELEDLITAEVTKDSLTGEIIVIIDWF